MDLGDPKSVASLLGHLERLSNSPPAWSSSPAPPHFGEDREQKDAVQRHTSRPESDAALADLCQTFVGVFLNRQDRALQNSTSRKILWRNLVLSAHAHYSADALSGQILLSATIVEKTESQRPAALGGSVDVSA
jgi:hypothetical protein